MVDEKRRQELLENLIMHPIGKEEEFSFRCNQCGECCRDRNDILLSPFDLCRMAVGLGLSISDIVENYCYLYVGNTSRFPLAALEMREDNGKCPFLKNNKCDIHVYKPSVCAMFPLGRTVARSKDDVQFYISYILQPVKCGEKDEIHTPREWMSGINLEVSEQFFLQWQDTVFTISEKIKEIYDDTPPRVLNSIYSNIFNILYLHYESDKSIVAQLKENKTVAIQLLDVVSRTIEDYKCVNRVDI